MVACVGGLRGLPLPPQPQSAPPPRVRRSQCAALGSSSGVVSRPSSNVTICTSPPPCFGVLTRMSLEAARFTAKPEYESRQTIELLDAVYEELEDTFFSRRGHLIPKRERAVVDATGGSATYGEVMPEGIQALVSKLDLGPESVFIDLGSGLGRAVTQVALTRPVKAAIGIELSASRHEQAIWILDRLQQQHNLRLTNVELQCDDVTTCSYEGGTHFLLCSTAFSASACRMIAARLAATSSFQVLVASRRLPPLPFLRKVGEFACAYSWNMGGTAYVYTRTDLSSVPEACFTKFLSHDGVCWLPHMHAFHIPIAAEEALLAMQ